MPAKPLVDVCQLSKKFFQGKTSLFALNAVNLSILPGQTVGLAGESGCGKSTLGKIILGLESATSGSVTFQDSLITSLSPSALRPLRRHMQMIFQDPYASLNPSMTVEEIIGEGLDIHQLASGAARRQKINDLLQQTGLSSAFLNRYPHEFSGGQRQRIGIARALAVDPLFVVCDEPLSALDACTQRQVMQLLLDLKRTKNLTSLFISHDLHAMRVLADTIAIMYLGHIVEQAPTARLFTDPKHPYTQALLSAIPTLTPSPSKRLALIHGEPPSPLSPPTGCPFHPRCPKALPICQLSMPPRQEVAPNHFVNCFLVPGKST